MRLPKKHVPKTHQRGHERECRRRGETEGVGGVASDTIKDNRKIVMFVLISYEKSIFKSRLLILAF